MRPGGASGQFNGPGADVALERRLLAVPVGNSVHLYSLATCTLNTVLQRHQAAVSAARFFGDGDSQVRPDGGRRQPFPKASLSQSHGQTQVACLAYITFASASASICKPVHCLALCDIAKPGMSLLAASRRHCNIYFQISVVQNAAVHRVPGRHAGRVGRGVGAADAHGGSGAANRRPGGSAWRHARASLDHMERPRHRPGNFLITHSKP